MIAYGRLIDTWVEISTLSETNNAQFFSEPESCALYRESSSGSCEPPIVQFVSFGLPICSVHLEEPKALLKNSGIEEHEFWILDLSNCSNGSRLPAYGARSLCIYRQN
jgi:hypothetical protein